MHQENFTFNDHQKIKIHVYKWVPEDQRKIKGIVQIAHGMGEHAGRYQKFAQSLTEAGFLVYANDHRGHGKTVKEIERLGIVGNDNFKSLVKNMQQLTQIIRTENPHLPIFLFGHSMGSFLTQEYMVHQRNKVQGVILSGTCGKKPTLKMYLVMLLAKIEQFFRGREAKSHLLHKLFFLNFNRFCKPTKTKYDWLSRNQQAVTKYLNDPFCGQIYSCQFYVDLLQGLTKLHTKKKLNNISKNLPIHLVGGSKDPVGNYQKEVNWLINSYRLTGLTNLTYRFYENGRHELLSEINCLEVIGDLIIWLNQQVNSRSNKKAL